MKIPSHLNPTIVSALGKIIHVGKPTDGLVVVDEFDEKPIISFDEVSDDDTVNLFLKFAPGAAFKSIAEETGTIVGSDFVDNTHEILVNRKDLEPLVKE